MAPKAKYLREIYFEPTMPLHPPTGKRIDDFTGALFCALPLRNYVEQYLRRKRRVLANGARDICICLTDKPRAESEIFKNSDTTILYIDIDYDPNQLFDLDHKNEVFGPLYARLVRDALEKVQHIGDLPFETITEAIAAYEESGYCFKYKVGERMIPGTKLKGTIHAELSCEHLLRRLVISYRGKRLLERVIAIQENIPIYYTHFPGFRLEGHTLFIGSEITDRDLATVDLGDEQKIVEILEKL